MSGIVNQPLAIRADANTQMGAGHVMRCLALAQAWQDGGGQAVFAMAAQAPAIEARLLSEGMEVLHLSAEPGGAEDASQTVDLARSREASWVAVDGYHFSSDYQRTIKESGLRVLAIDDNEHAEHYYADIVLNQNLHAHDCLYQNRELYTRLLLGTRYALLRREFLKWRGWKREIPQVARKVLVTLGGCDPHGVTLKVIEALQQVEVEELEVVALAGAIDSHYKKLESAVRHSPTPIRIVQNATTMPALMAWADAAVCAGGSTCWELAFMRLPSTILVLADNQQPIAQGLDGAKVAVNLGRQEDRSPAEIAEGITELLVTPGTRAQMSKRSQELVDGEGAARVLVQIGGKTLELREVRDDDCGLLWEWRNDPQVRAASFSSHAISWQGHVRWFTSKLNDPQSAFYIAVNPEGTPIGQIRYDITGNEAVVSTSIDRKFRGKGYGSTAIRLASRELLRASNLDTIHAYIKQGNEISTRAFLTAGFKTVGTRVINRQQAIHLVLAKDDLI